MLACVDLLPACLADKVRLSAALALRLNLAKATLVSDDPGASSSTTRVTFVQVHGHHVFECVDGIGQCDREWEQLGWIVHGDRRRPGSQLTGKARASYGFSSALCRVIRRRRPRYIATF